MIGKSSMFTRWFRTQNITESFVSATYPCEIASSAPILGALLKTDMLSCIAGKGKISPVTCFNFKGDSYFVRYAPENIKNLTVYKEV
jgi:hypothetical protein